MPPEATIGRKPKEGLQQNGTVLVRLDHFNLDSRDLLGEMGVGLLLRRDGFEVTFADRCKVAELIEGLVPYLDLKESRDVVIEEEKEVLLGSIAQSLINGQNFGQEDEELHMRFDTDDFSGVGYGYFEFSRQGALNKTVLLLLPHANIRQLENPSTVIATILKSAGLFDPQSVADIRARVLSEPLDEYPQDIIVELEDVERTIFSEREQSRQLPKDQTID